MVSPDQLLELSPHSSKDILDYGGFFICGFDLEVEYSHVITFEIKG